MTEPTAKMVEVLRALAESGNLAHYMRYMGRFNPRPYYFLSSTHELCTSQIEGLVKRGLAEKFDVEQFGDHKVRISRKGRRYLKDTAATGRGRR